MFHKLLNFESAPSSSSNNSQFSCLTEIETIAAMGENVIPLSKVEKELNACNLIAGATNMKSTIDSATATTSTSTVPYTNIVVVPNNTNSCASPLFPHLGSILLGHSTTTLDEQLDTNRSNHTKLQQQSNIDVGRKLSKLIEFHQLEETQLMVLRPLLLSPNSTTSTTTIENTKTCVTMDSSTTSLMSEGVSFEYLLKKHGLKKSSSALTQRRNLKTTSKRLKSRQLYKTIGIANNQGTQMGFFSNFNTLVYFPFKNKVKIY
jgi:hypothetical protein